MRFVSCRILGHVWTGLLIASCVAACGTNAENSTASVDGGPEPVAGEAGGPCYPNATCNEGLACTDGVCVAHSAGEAGGPCYPNNSCNEA